MPFQYTQANLLTSKTGETRFIPGGTGILEVEFDNVAVLKNVFLADSLSFELA